MSTRNSVRQMLSKRSKTLGGKHTGGRGSFTRAFVKIVCTIGPATESVGMLMKLLRAGMNVARLNFSHGDFAQHQKVVNNLRRAMRLTGISCAIMQDLSGPKIRIGDFDTESVLLKMGDILTLTTEAVTGNRERVSVNYKSLPREVKVGGFIMLHDGRLKLKITEIKGEEVKCKVIIGGEIKGRRGINLPGARLSISSLTDKDKKDVQFGIRNNVDFVAFSFVRRVDDVLELRALLEKAGSEAQIISKIEDEEALKNIDDLIEASDGIMVARGDLAIEIGVPKMPYVQRDIISRCNAVGKPVITATQVLESMILSPVPTRAEVQGIDQAILQGTDAIMLSEESTLGRFPVRAVEVMTEVAAENEPRHPLRIVVSEGNVVRPITNAVSISTIVSARDLGAKLIFAFTTTGHTARMISRHKPTQPIIALVSREKVFRRLLMSYACFPVLTKGTKTSAEVQRVVQRYALKNHLAKKGDTVIIAGDVVSGQVESNMMLILTL